MCSPAKMEFPSLTEISFSVVGKSFDRHCVAFKDPNCKVPWKLREFLKRFFSAALFDMLSSEGKLKAVHLDILINKHTKDLNILEIKKSLLPQLIRKLKTYGESVVSLEGASRILSKPLISTVPNLERIFVIDCPSPRVFRAIGKKCPQLKVLEMVFLSDFRYEVLCTGLSFVLKHCPALEILQYLDTVGILYRMHKDDILAVKKKRKSTSEDCQKYALKSIMHIKDPKINYPLADALKVSAVMCPHVTKLALEELNSDEELQEILNFDLLEIVKFKCISGVTLSCFNEFLKIKGGNLTSITLPFASHLSMETLIKCCPKLKSLKFNNIRNSFTVGVATISKIRSELPCDTSLSELKSLELSGINFCFPVNANALKLLLLVSPNLKELDIELCQGFTNEFVQRLNLYSIPNLYFCHSDITVDVLKELLLHGSFQALNIRCCRGITPNDFENLAKDLSKEQISNVDIK